MEIKYCCCFCGKIYDWYDGLYENPEYNGTEKLLAKRKGQEYNQEPGVFINANSLRLYRIDPAYDDTDGKPVTLEVKDTHSNLDCYINACPDCMRKIIDNLKMAETESGWDFA